MKKNIFKRLSENKSILLTGIVVFLACSITIGYAAYEELLTLGITVHVPKVETVEIDDITLLENSNLSNNGASASLKNISINDTFTCISEECYALYEIQLTNNSNLDYIYSGNDTEKNITSSVLEDTAELDVTFENIDTGLIIPAGESIVFRVRVSINNPNNEATYEVNINTDLDFTIESSGNIVASLNTNSIDLRNNQTASVSIEVINTYSYARSFTISQTNNNLILNDGQNIVYSIPANSTESYTVNIKASPEAIFLTTEETTSINLSPTYLSTINIGNLNVSVDEYVEPDTEAPTVGNALLTITDTIGQFNASWDRIDTEGTSIVNYNLKLYTSDGTLSKEVNTNSSSTTYTFTDMEANQYYLVVSGEDEAGNNGLTSMDTATTANGYATKSSTVNMKWIFSVTYTLRGATSNGANTAQLHTSYSATVSNNSNYTLPSEITITMAGNTLVSGSDYTYSSSNGQITINNVTGDIVITVTATRNTCLIEGTKILLADNTYKNIENIDYTDLLKVYSYEDGRFVNVYPIWIEKKHETSYYQLNTFSDGTELRTIGFHGIYDADKNMFVSVDNRNDFKVGTNVLMYDKDKGNFKKITVAGIEEIFENKNYYHVVSTRYYNVIANNLLTTDGTVVLSNLYGFDNNAMWTSLRKLIMQNTNNLYSYEDFSDIMPYYMFKALRVEEGKILNNYGLSLPVFKGYLSGNQLNNELMKEPLTNSNNKRVWMVTTSDDIVVDKSDYLLEEGSFYKLKEPINKENFDSWYDTGSGKYYKPNEIVQIWYGTYFEAIYK